MKRVLIVLLSVTGATLFSVAAIAKEAHPKHTLHNSTGSHSEAQKLMGTIPKKYNGSLKSFTEIVEPGTGDVELVEPWPGYDQEFLDNMDITSPIPQRKIEFKPDNTIGIIQIIAF